MEQSKILKTLLNNKITVILRGIEKESICPLCEALINGGIKQVEITFDQSREDCVSHTAELIRLATEHFGGALTLGAGTVLDKDQVKAAYESGAQFILAPNVDSEIIRFASSLEMVPVPGAMTPTEICEAVKYGVPIVKLFPADNLGVKYIRAVRAPLSNIKLMAVGGVNEHNLTEFLSVAEGVGIGNAIANRELIAKADYKGITRLAMSYTNQL